MGYPVPIQHPYSSPAHPPLGRTGPERSNAAGPGPIITSVGAAKCCGLSLPYTAKNSLKGP